MEPQTPSRTASHLRAANASFASVLAAGCFYLIAAPHPHASVPANGFDAKQGPTRSTAVASDAQAQRETAVTRDAAATRSQPVPPESAVKVIGAATDGGKPCHEQTWPYIETRCLTVANAKPVESKPDNAAPRGLRDLLANTRPGGIEAPVKSRTPEPEVQPVGSITAIAPTPPVKDMQANTIGSETPQHATDGVASRDDADIPLPQPRPDVTLASLSTAPDVESDNASAAPRPMSRAEYRRLERDQRRAARDEERERRRREWAERRAGDPARVVRRWTEYSYEDDSRVVVIHQGSRRDRFFRTYR